MHKHLHHTFIFKQDILFWIPSVFCVLSAFCLLTTFYTGLLMFTQSRYQDKVSMFGWSGSYQPLATFHLGNNQGVQIPVWLWVEFWRCLAVSVGQRISTGYLHTDCFNEAKDYGKNIWHAFSSKGSCCADGDFLFIPRLCGRWTSCTGNQWMLLRLMDSWMTWTHSSSALKLSCICSGFLLILHYW